MSFRIRNNNSRLSANSIKGVDIAGDKLEKGQLIQFTGKFWSYTDLPNLGSSTGPTGPRGNDGVAGPTGPSGDFLNNFRSNWEFNTELIPITPDNGIIAFNSEMGASVTKILVSSFTVEGGIAQPILGLVQNGNKIFLCSSDDRNCKLWKIDSIEEFETYFIFNVTFDSETSSINFYDGEKIKIFFDIFSNQVIIQQNSMRISNNETAITNLQLSIQQKDTEIESLKSRVTALENLIRRNHTDNTIELNGEIKLISF